MQVFDCVGFIALHRVLGRMAGLSKHSLPQQVSSNLFIMHNIMHAIESWFRVYMDMDFKAFITAAVQSCYLAPYCLA